MLAILRKALSIAVNLGWLLAVVPALSAERHNWFSDPFLQLSAERPGCPAPDGPLLTEAQMKAQSHHRIESGNSCFFAGACGHASAYAYDKDIAAAARRRLQGKRTLLRRSTLWITVQRRFVFVEGCVRSSRQLEQVGAALAALPDVKYVGTDGVWVEH